MSGSSRTPPLPMSVDRQIDELCDEFEAELPTGNPEIEHYLRRIPQRYRYHLVEELLRLEIEAICQRGEIPSEQDYRDRFEDFGPQVRSAMQSAASGTHDADTLIEAPSTTNDEAMDETPAEGVPKGARQFGDYELLQEIARGGMGVVYKARHLKLNRIVALKMVLTGAFASKAATKRFFVEAEAAAALSHSGVVPIYEIGEHGGQHYYSMEFVEGGNLSDLVHARPLSSKEAISLIAKTADAIAHAHSKAVIHRDLKPANVLLNRDGTPRVTDFGLARRLDDNSGLTATGDVLGTPGYMPPEQARGETEQVGKLADVYSLGAILYFLLTGRAPFQAANALETLRQVQESEPVSPRQLNPEIPRDVETICLKCLQKAPFRRYQSVEELIQECQRFLAGRSIRARPIGPVQRSMRWARRNPVISLQLGLIATVILGATIAIWWQARNVAKARDVAQQRLDESQTSEYIGLIAQADAEYRVGDLVAMRSTLKDALPAGPVPDRRNWEWYYLNHIQNAALRTFQAGRPGNWSLSSAITPDETHLVTGASPPYFGSTTADSEGDLRLWNLETGKLVHEFQGSSPLRGITAIAIDSSGTRMATAESNWRGGTSRPFPGQLRFWDLQSGAELMRFDAPTRIRELRYSTDGKKLVGQAERCSGQPVARLLAWNAVSGQVESTSTLSADEFSTVRALGDSTSTSEETLGWQAKRPISSNNGLIADLTDSARALSITSMSNSQDRDQFWAQTGVIEGFCFHPDSSSIAVGGNDSSSTLWELSNHNPTLTVRGHDGQHTHCSFSPSGHLFVTGGWDGKAHIWNATRHPEFLSLEESTYPRDRRSINAIQFTQDDHIVVVRSFGGQVQRFDAQTGALDAEFVLSMEPDEDGLYRIVTLSGDGRRLAVLAPGDRHRILIHDLASKSCIRTLTYTVPLRTIRLNRDGTVLLGITEEDTVVVTEANPSSEQASWWTIPGEATDASLSSDGNLIGVSVSEIPEPAVALWNRRSQKLIARRNVKSTAFALHVTDSGHVVTADPVNLTVYRQQNLGAPLSFPAVDRIEDLRFLPDNRRVVGASRTRTFMWDASTGHKVLTLEGPRRAYDYAFGPSVAVSDDGKRIAASQWDTSVDIWSAGYGTRPFFASASASSWHRSQAQYHSRGKRWYSAEFHLAQVARKNPNDLGARLRRIGLLNELGRRNEADKVYESLLPEVKNPGMLLDGRRVVTAQHIPFDKLDKFTVEVWCRDWEQTLFAQGRSGDPENSIYLDLGLHGVGWESTTPRKPNGGDNFEVPIGPRLGPGWHHLALVWDGDSEQQRIYLDGVLVSRRRTPPPGPFRDQRPLHISLHELEVLPNSRGCGFLRSIRVSDSARYVRGFSPEDRWQNDNQTLLLLDFTKADEVSVPNLANPEQPAVISLAP